MRVPLIAANWKMNKTTQETRDFIIQFTPMVAGIEGVEIVIAPPFTSLAVAAKFLKGSGIKLGAQNIFYEKSGAYTGEISPLMIKDCGCEYVIIGHSERRQYFQETDVIINKKLRAAQEAGLSVILCIGETITEREQGKTFNVIKTQLIEGLKDAKPESLVIAYEPVWAIGTGRTASVEQIREAHGFIRTVLRDIFKEEAEHIRIQYGGSVNPENAFKILNIDNVDGALVGGASLKPDSFTSIILAKGVRR
ncbi:MAG: triose-phosphate isomerase [Thermodesulfovibrionales bacterium]|nr:triose-phosphate isomerase [Thermodesulfovibrionales bacterium]